MSDGPRELREIHRQIAQVVGDEVEGMIPEDTAYVLVIFKFPGPECGDVDEDLGGGVASNAALMVPFALANSLRSVCDPRALVALVEAVRETDEAEGGTC